MPTMADLTLRLTKGTPLTPLELDENFRVLRDYSNSLGALFGVALNPDGTLKNPSAQYIAAGGGPSAYTIARTPVTAALADLTGKLLLVNFPLANVGAVTVNPDGLGAVNVKKFGNVALESDDIKINQIGILVYDGTNFQYESWPGVVQPTNYIQATGVADAYVATHSASGYFQEPAALYAGYTVWVRIPNPGTNATTTPTIQIGALPAATIVKSNGSAVAIGDLVANGIYQLVHDGTNFQMAGSGSSRATVYRTADTDFTVSATSVQAQVLGSTNHGLLGNPDVVQLFFVNKADTGGANAHGYAVGDVLPFESVKAQFDKSTIFTVGLYGTTFTLFQSGLDQNVSFCRKAGTTMHDATPAQFVADWKVRVVLIRYS